MRINLNCPYSEKDQAKALGARWDASRKTWYIVDVEDLSPFLRWLPEGREPSKPKALLKVGPVFEKWCSCNCPPWEECEHTSFVADKQAVSHLRDIMGQA